MSDHDKDDLDASMREDLGRKTAIARVLEKARDTGLCPDGRDDKAFMDEMWCEDRTRLGSEPIESSKETLRIAKGEV